MSEASTIEALRNALQPVAALRSEHSQLVTWVQDSFATLEKLHSELSDARNCLVRKEAELDQRMTELDRRCHELDDLKAESARRDSESSVESEKLQGQIARLRSDAAQWESDNAEQLAALEELDRSYAQSRTELKSAQDLITELKGTLELERQRASDAQQLWAAELKEYRLAMERHRGENDLPRDAEASATGESPDVANLSDAPAESESRLDEIRRRAQARRVAKSLRSSTGDEDNNN